MLSLVEVKRTYPALVQNMVNHYSKPKGFVGRNICYAILFDDVYYGAIVGGSATKHLAGRNSFFHQHGVRFELNNVVNNIFYHVEKRNGRYPMRNFVSKVISQFRTQIEDRWFEKYGDEVLGFETLVELPRSGDCYKRDGWELVGRTKGYTCKRIGGKGTDAWTGKRVWNVNELRPKNVFCKLSSSVTRC